MKVYGLRSNAASRVDRQPLHRSGDFSALSPPEVEALARAAENDQDAALFRVAAFTGLRLTEIRALTWRAVDWEKRLVHVRRSYTHGAEGDPKSGKVRSVPLIDQAARALDGLSRRERFTGPEDEVGGYLHDGRLRGRFHEALGRAELPRMRLHDLRHTFGTIAMQAFPLSDVMAYMGHADISTTMVYVHHVPQGDAADKLTSVVATSESPLVAKSEVEAAAVEA